MESFASFIAHTQELAHGRLSHYHHVCQFLFFRGLSATGLVLLGRHRMDGSHLFAPAPDASAQQNLKSLLLALAHTFSPSKEEGNAFYHLAHLSPNLLHKSFPTVILREFDKQYQENDVVASLKLFLREVSLLFPCA